MSVNETRNLNAALREGLSDGSVKRDAPDRGGVTAYDNHDTHLLQQQYGTMTSMSAAEDSADRLYDAGIRRNGYPTHR